MVNFSFNKDQIGQHIVKFGIDIRPALTVHSDKHRLTPYCEWLIEEFPDVFETILSGRNRLQVQKTFVASNNQKVELPTFVLTPRGFVYTFPIKLPVVEIEDFDVPNKNQIIAKALKQFKSCFGDKRIPRVGVINEIIFDCGKVDSTEILAHALSKKRWKEGIRNVKIHLENPREGNNITFDIMPVVAQQVQTSSSGLGSSQNVGYGISVKLDINNQDTTDDLNETEIQGIIGFAETFIGDDFYEFLNSG